LCNEAWMLCIFSVWLLKRNYKEFCGESKVKFLGKSSSWTCIFQYLFEDFTVISLDLPMESSSLTSMHKYFLYFKWRN
jgi:hypothetical protein